MKKILSLTFLLLTLGTSLYASENEVSKTEEEVQVSKEETEDKWWLEAGEPDSEYWWINGYEDQSE